MHPESLRKMSELFGRALSSCSGDVPYDVLDVGSLDVNGSFRPLVEGLGCSYTGLDVRDGRNVDVVSDDMYRYPFPDESFDVVLSGSTMEHVLDLHSWVAELFRILRKGGCLIIITHHTFPEHKYPVDAWRVFPDGMEFLLYSFGNFSFKEVKIFNNSDIYAFAIKSRDGNE